MCDGTCEHDEVEELFSIPREKEGVDFSFLTREELKNEKNKAKEQQTNKQKPSGTSQGETVAVIPSCCGTCSKRLDGIDTLQIACSVCLKIVYCCPEHLDSDRERHKERCGQESCLVMWEGDPTMPDRWLVINCTNERTGLFIFEKNIHKGSVRIRTTSNKPGLPSISGIPNSEFKVVGIMK